MPFASGVAAGSAAVTQGQNIQQGRDRLGIDREKQKLAVQKSLDDQYNKIVTDIDDQAKRGIETFKQFVATKPEIAEKVATKFLDNMKAADVQRYQAATAAGKPPPGPRYTNEFRALLEGVTNKRDREQKQILDAEVAARAAVAKTQAIAKGLNQPVNAVAQAQGQIPAPATPPTDPLMVKLQNARQDAQTRGNRVRAAEISAQITKLGTITGTTPQDPGAVLAGDKEAFRGHMNFVESSVSALSETSRLRDQLSSDKTFTGLTSTVIRGLSNVAQTMVQGSKALGFDESKLLDPSQYSLDGFGGDAASSAGFKSNVVNLAFILARAAEPNARQLSNEDVKRQIDRFAAGSGDKGQILASLDEVDRAVRSRAKVRDSVVRQFIPGLPPLDKRLSGGSAQNSPNDLMEQLKTAKTPEAIDAIIRKIDEIEGKK